MRHSVRLLAAGFLSLGVYSAAGLACSSMGSATHAGNIMSVDEGAKTFTIMDYQTMKPITFSADEKIMRLVMGAEGAAIVDYTGEGDDLTATSVQLQ